MAEEIQLLEVVDTPGGEFVGYMQAIVREVGLLGRAAKAPAGMVYFAKQPGQQFAPLFLTTSTGAHIEARVHILFHPCGRYERAGKRFDVLFPDIAIDPSLTPPTKAEIHDSVFGCFTPDETSDAADKMTIGYHRPTVSPFRNLGAVVTLNAGANIHAGEAVYYDVNRDCLVARR